MSRFVKAHHESKNPDITPEDELVTPSTRNEAKQSNPMSEAGNRPDISFVKSSSAAVYRAGLNPTNLLSLQRTLGNRVVRSLIQRNTEARTIQRNPGKKLYVGNLSYATSNAELEQMFAQFGTVNSAQIIEDRLTGRSKGFGFVEMSSDEEAQAAIKGLNGKVNDGRSLTVNEARPREDREGGGGGGGDYGGGRRGGGGGGGYGGGGGGGRGSRY